MGISIHAPHEGERPTPAARISIILPFQSTLPTRGSDRQSALLCHAANISIHAPHEGERPITLHRHTLLDDFNPRSPRGGATRRAAAYVHGLGFQSTLPTRGSDPRFMQIIRAKIYFNPRSPRGGATADLAHDARRKRISIHAPHEGERPCPKAVPWSRSLNFNPRSPRGGATSAYHPIDNAVRRFQSTLPTRGSDLFCPFCLPCTLISIHAPHEGERRIHAG